MKFRFRLLLLAALVILVAAGSTAAREETKPQDGGESTDIKAADDGNSKKQKDDTQLDSGKVRVKQKWQRYKPPSSKKAKKAALRKEKALGKSGKAKWKAAAEGVSKRKEKPSAEYGKEGGRNKQKWTKEKSLKKSKEKSFQAEKLQLNGGGKELNGDALRDNVQGSKVIGKQEKKGKSKTNKDSNVCSKDELCSSGSEKSVDHEKNKWKRKHSSETGMKGVPAKLKKVATTDSEEDLNDETESPESNDANGGVETKSDKNIGEGKPKNTVKQRTAEGSKEAGKLKSAEKKRKSALSEMDEDHAMQPDDPEEWDPKRKAAKVEKQEDTDSGPEEVVEDDTEGSSKIHSGNRKVKRSYIVEEEYDPECTSCLEELTADGADVAKASNGDDMRSSAGLTRIRRYIVEEEVIEDDAAGDQEAVGDEEMPELME